MARLTEAERQQLRAAGWTDEDIDRAGLESRTATVGTPALNELSGVLPAGAVPISQEIAPTFLPRAGQQNVPWGVPGGDVFGLPNVLRFRPTEDVVGTISRPSEAPIIPDEPVIRDSRVPQPAAQPQPIPPETSFRSPEDIRAELGEEARAEEPVSRTDRDLGMAFLGLGAQQVQAARAPGASRLERWGGLITAMGGLLRMTGGSKTGMALGMLGTLTNMAGQRVSGRRRADFARGWANSLSNALNIAQRRYNA
jgi:hypothetical protein